MFGAKLVLSKTVLVGLVGLVSMSVFPVQSLADEVETVVRLAASGTPSELETALSGLPMGEAEALRFGRNHTLAHAAISNENYPAVLSVIAAAGVDLDARDDDGRTALHHAIDNDNSKAARLLIKLGAGLEIENDAGYSPLRFCQDALRSLPNHATCQIVIEEARLTDE